MVHPERESRGDIRPISDQLVMASLYILILMTVAAKPVLSLQQVPPSPTRVCIQHIPAILHQHHLWSVETNGEDEGREQNKAT